MHRCISHLEELLVQFKPAEIQRQLDLQQELVLADTEGAVFQVQRDGIEKVIKTCIII